MGRSLVRVRPAVPDDAAALVDLWADLLTVAGSATHTAERPCVDGVQRRLSAVADRTDRVILVAELDGSVCGAAYLSREPLTPLHDAVAARLSYLHVLPGCRRQGAGHAILEAAVHQATEWGAEHVVTDVVPVARDTNRFLARLGLGQLIVQRAAPVPALRRRLAMDVLAAVAPDGPRRGFRPLRGLARSQRSMSMQVNRAVATRRPDSSVTTTS